LSELPPLEGVGGDEKVSSGEEWEADDETSTQLDVDNSSAEKIKSKKKKKKKIKNVADNLDNESDLISEKNVKRKKGKIKKKKIVDDTESVVEDATFNDTNLEVNGDNTAVTHANLKPTSGINSIEDDKTNVDARPILESAESTNQQDSLDANIESLESDQEYEGVAKPTEAVKKVKKKKKKNTAEDSSIKKKKKSKKERKMEEMNNITKSDKEVCEMIVNNEDEDMNQDDDASDSEHLMNIREAFANDDVVGDFVNEKDALLESAKPVDLTLPGWGEWTGPGLKVSSRKRKKFTKEEKDKPARKDAKLSHVIINEDRNKKMAKIKVSNVPFPYTSKAEFERSIRQPIGPHWNTPSVVNKLTEPRIKVRAGHIIKPLHATKGQKKAWKSNQTQS
jgi:U3 small nucleolar RNA-associated protein 14